MPLLKCCLFYITYTVGLIPRIFWSVCLVRGGEKGDFHHIFHSALDQPPLLLSPTKGRSFRKVLHCWKLDFRNSCNTTGRVMGSYHKSHQGLYGLTCPTDSTPQCDKIILFKILKILKVYQAGPLVISKE